MHLTEYTYQAEGAAAGDSTALEGAEHAPEEAVPGFEGVELVSEEAGLEPEVVVVWMAAAWAAGTEEHWQELKGEC